MWRYFALRRISNVFLETLLLACCGLGGHFVHFSEFPPDLGEGIFLFCRTLIVAVLFQLSLHLCDVYHYGQQLSAKFYWRLFRAVVLAVLISCVVFYIAPWTSIGQRVFALNLIFVSLFVFLWHIILRPYLRKRIRRTNLLIIGAGELSLAAVREVLDFPELGIRIVGFIADASDADAVSSVNAKIVGNYHDFTNLVTEHSVNHIVVGLSDRRKKLPIETLLDLKTKGVVIEDVTAFYERVTGKIPVENLMPSWLVFNRGFDVSKDTILKKRVFSIFLALVLSVLTSPLLLLATVIIKLDSKGPVFYKQSRVGKNGRVFTLVKFRSMRQNAEKLTGPVWSTPGEDNRVTRVGRFLRRSRIDELPQLYNVLLGDMDMVGPRPERPVFVEQLSRDIPYYPLRHTVRPGITGWAQVSYGYANKIEHTVQKLQYDLFYIKNLSLALDLMVIFETVKTVLVRKGS